MLIQWRRANERNEFNKTENMSYTQKPVNKIALSPEDDKRVILNNKIDTLSHGHYMMEMINTYKNIFGFDP